MSKIFAYNFGFGGSFDDVDEKPIRERITTYFEQRDDAKLLEFVGNTTPPNGDIMRVRVEMDSSGAGDAVIDDLKERKLDNGVYIIQGGPDD